MLVLPSFFPDVIHQFQEVPLQSIIDETVVLLNKENDGYRAEKFVSLIRMSHNLLGYLAVGNFKKRIEQTVPNDWIV